MNKIPVSICAILGLLAFAGCSQKAKEAAIDIAPEAAAFYKAHPDQTRIATPADLPAGLVWHDGHDVPEWASPDAKRGGTFNFWIDDFPRTLRFYGPDANGSFRAYILDDEAIGLIQKQPNTGQYYPGLAKEWAYDKDGRTMYFRIDPDARYCDGVPVRADDFLFAFFFLQSRYLDDPMANNLFADIYARVTKYDDLTISVTMKVSRPDIEDQLSAFVPVPEHFYKELGPDFPQRYQWRLEPTTGPYTIRPEDLHKGGSSIDLTRVPNWWADNKPFYRHRYNPDRVHFEVIRDTDKAFEAFKRGDLDLSPVNSPESWYDKLPNNDPLVQRGCIAKVVFYNQIPRPNYAFYINTSQPLLDNHDVREGIAYASNFDLVDQQHFRGDFVRMQTSADGYAEVPFPDIHPRPFSVDKALACFAKAGFTKRGPDGILVNAQGQRLSFTVTTPYDRLRDVLTILRQEAAKAGLELNVEVLDATTAFKKIMEKHDQIALTAYDVGKGKYPEYSQLFESTFANKPQTNNITNTVDPKMDELIEAYKKATTMDEIRRLAHDIEVRIYDDAAFIPAFEAPYFRVAYWRWLKFPKDFATRESDDPFADGLFWIDDSARPAVLAARDGGAPLPPEIKVYDRWKQN